MAKHSFRAEPHFGLQLLLHLAGQGMLVMKWNYTLLTMKNCGSFMNTCCPVKELCQDCLNYGSIKSKIIIGKDLHMVRNYLIITYHRPLTTISSE